jgi:rod shape-determining protein MreC
MLSGRRTLTLFVVLCLGHILLISSQVQAGAGQTALQATAFGAVASVQTAAAGASGGIGRLWSNYFALVGASRENEALRTKVIELEGQLQGEQARGVRVSALESALNLQKSLVASTLSAHVIAASPVPGPVPGAEPITIDRGKADGVTPNMAVISGRGVVGRVIGDPAQHASRVQLLVGHSAAAGAVIERTSTAGLVQGGFADGKLRMAFVSSGAQITVGDRVVTSGQDRIYPQGFLIGHVGEVKGTGKDREIVVVPAVDFSYIEVVLIVLAREPQAAK